MELLSGATGGGVNGVKYVICPFCDEKDFDLIGLKMHFLRGWCDKYNETPDHDKGTMTPNPPHFSLDMKPDLS